MSLVPRKLTTCTLTNGHCKSSYRNCKCKVVYWTPISSDTSRNIRLQLITSFRANPGVNAYHFNTSLTPILHQQQNGNSNGDAENGNHLQTFHLVRPPMDDSRSSGKQWQSPNGQMMDRTPKAIPEIFLTRLLSTKGTIEKFVVDFFRTILTVDEHLPPAIKWLFDLLDEGARKHGIQDPEVLHAWKSNR